MSFVHPVQTILSTSDGKTLFLVIKNMILVLQKTVSNGESLYKIIGKWIDELDRTAIIKHNVVKEQKRQIAANEEAGIVKKAKKNTDASTTPISDNVTEVLNKPIKEAKVPMPGIGAPPIFLQIRNVLLSSDEKQLYACTDSDKSVLIFDIDLSSTDNCLSLNKRQLFPKRPNSITITPDNQSIIMADKFGDVYDMSITDKTTIELNDLKPILGHVSMLTSVLAVEDPETKKKFVITSDRDEHIKISHYPQTFIVDKWLFGHKEFLSFLNVPKWTSQQNILISAGGDHSIFIWDWKTGKLLSTFDYTKTIEPYLTDKHLAPSKFQNENNDSIEFTVSNVATLESLPYTAFFVEATKLLIILKIDTNTGANELFQTIELPQNIISLSSISNLGFVLSLDSSESAHEDMARFVNFNEKANKFELDDESKTLNKSLVELLADDRIAKVVKDTDIYPFYTTINLKKHGEYYS